MCSVLLKQDKSMYMEMLLFVFTDVDYIKLVPASPTDWMRFLFNGGPMVSKMNLLNNVRFSKLYFVMYPEVRKKIVKFYEQFSHKCILHTVII